MSIEIALQARNAVLAGERIQIKVPPKAELDKPSTEWAKVLGVLAAGYSFKPAVIRHIAEPQAERKVENETTPDLPDFNRDVMRISNDIYINLASSISSKNVGEIARLSAPSRLFDWADGQMTDNMFLGERVPAKEATALFTDRLTQRGIETFAGMSMGVAVLLTELLSSDDSYGRDSTVIRKIVTERGYGLLIPSMTSEEMFSRLGNVNKELLCDPRADTHREAKYLITYKSKQNDLAHLRWDIDYSGRNASTGCPFAFAEHGKDVKPAWKLAVDTMWDELLEWRVKTPISA